MRKKTYRRTRNRVGAVSRRRRRIRGGSRFMKFLSKANKFLRKSKLISQGSKFLSKNTKLPYMDKIAAVSQMAGYGLSTTGGSLRLAGQGRRRRVVRRRRRYR